jgi:hypothetical protein
MRQPEGVEIIGEPLHAYVTGTDATPAAIVRFAVNRTA